MNLVQIFNAVRAGQELSNAETWKRRQVAINALVVVITAGVAIAQSFGYNFPINEEQIGDIAGGLYGIVGMFNAWATLATTSRIGLPPRPGAEPAGRDDGGRYPDPPQGNDYAERPSASDDRDEDYVPYLNDTDNRG